MSFFGEGDIMKLQQIKIENDVERLILLRKRLNMRQYEFAKLVGVSTNYIANIENYRMPITTHLIKKVNLALSRVERDELVI